VGGNVFAFGLNGSNGDVLLRPSNGVIMKGIHAKGTVTISSGCTVKGNVYASKDISLLSSHSVNQGIIGNAYAGRNILKESGGRVGGTSYAGGSINQHMSANKKQGYPPLIAPELTMSLPVPPPVLTSFTVGTSNITLQPNWKNPNPQLVAPGRYNILTASYGNTVRLKSGDYYFDTVNANESAIRLQLDISSGPINIYVKNNLTFGSSFTVEISENGSTYTNVRTINNSNPAKAQELAGKVYTEVHGNVGLGPATSSWYGTLIVKNNAYVGNSFMIIGALAVVNGQAIFDANPEMIYAPPTESAGGEGTGSQPGAGPGQSGSGGHQSEIALVFSKPIRDK